MSRDHEHTPGHDHARGAEPWRLVVAIGIVAVVLVIEVVGVALSGSLALLADAGHMLSDLIGLVVALIAAVIAARPATDRQTFGFRRAEVFGALINGMILTVIAVFVSIEAVTRLIAFEPGEVQSTPMLVVAVIGALANIAALLVLRGGAKHSINMRGAYAEVLGDLMGSIGVIVAGVVILTTGFARADAVASLFIAMLIVPRAFSLLREVVHVLSESAPRETDVALIREHILAKEGVVAVHDVHVWAITAGAPVFTAHVVVEPSVFTQGRADEMLDRLSACLSTHFDVEHSTFQLEVEEHAEHEEQTHR